MSRKLPILAEIGAPASSDAGAWGLRRGDYEQLRGLREKLDGRRVLLVSGDEAATPTVAVGLAGAAASTGTVTALIECDVERPRLAAALGLAPTPGLHEYLRWEAAPVDVLQPLAPAGPASDREAVPLVCVCAGRPSADPRTLLGLGSFRHMTAKLRGAYEMVVLLGPPLEGAGGALGSVAAEADGALAALTGTPSRREAKSTHEALAWLGTPPLGAVVVTS